MMQTAVVQLWLHIQRWVLDTANRIGEVVKYQRMALRSTVGPVVVLDPADEQQCFEVRSASQQCSACQEPWW